MSVFNFDTMQVKSEVAFDVQMDHGRAVKEFPLLNDTSRVRVFSQSQNVSGALRVELASGTGFTIVSSNEPDSGLIYCEVVI